MSSEILKNRWLEFAKPDRADLIFRQAPSSGRTDESSEARLIERELTENLGPNAQTSISHTGGVVIGIGIESEQAIGVDLELSERKISEGIRARLLITEFELSLTLSTLVIWTIKEALFKSISKTSGLRVMSEIEIVSCDLTHHKGTARFQDLAHAKFSWIETPKHFVAFARGVSVSEKK